MATRIYKTPFAATGDKEPLATADQPDGKVSLQAGWTPDYELPNDNAGYRPIGRAEMNGILGELTEGLGELQQFGFAKWQAIDGGWPADAMAVHGGVVYTSTDLSNTTEPGSPGAKWQRSFLHSPMFSGVPTAPTAGAGTNTTQLATTAFVQSAVSQALPAGAVEFFAMNTAPATWLKANGAAVSVATYAALATNIYCGDSLNATALFGFRCTDPANPSTTRSTTGGYIVLPDLRGEFPRAWDDSRGVDSGRAFGSAQGAAVDSAGVQLRQASTTWAVTGVGIGAAVGYLSNSAISSYGSNMAVFGGTETRPRNVALLACIKF